ncbi:MAG: hypothetical protein GYA55_09675 [SAR324 cluster bacterium]|uniref:Tetratricopeptide repeat protein n=1 Tax=SAR324 cluster bacterium TaxID=2024889 RepID=A0A7X9ILW5_9DELT|nr:hypothetical protein [SAR324 cluster bacterium]
MTIYMRPTFEIPKLPTLLLSFIFCLLTRAHELKAETLDPFDPFDNSSFEITTNEEGDKDKSAKQLILEAAVLLDDERLLDARTKLLRALQRDPLDYRAHLMLSGYYLDHVGHFRLSLKYAKRALDLFYKTKGYPPYNETGDRMSHQQLLYLISQIRLNLDDYNGSLRTLDEFSSYGYTAPWYSGSRAWVLMKLGKIEEAIKVARQGVEDASEP